MVPQEAIFCISDNNKIRNRKCPLNVFGSCLTDRMDSEVSLNGARQSIARTFKRKDYDAKAIHGYAGEGETPFPTDRPSERK